MRTFKSLILLVSFLACSLLLKANSGEKDKKKLPEGLLHGYIVDAETKKPVSGVSISLSSNKMPSEKEVVSDAAGYFNFGKIPAGDLTVIFEKKGYKFYKKDAMPLKEGTTIKMAVEVEPENDNNDIWNPLYRLLSK